MDETLAKHPDAYRNDLYEKFIAWAAGYDENSIVFGTRTLANHEVWLQKLQCKVLEIISGFVVEERLKSMKELIIVGVSTTSTII